MRCVTRRTLPVDAGRLLSGWSFVKERIYVLVFSLFIVLAEVSRVARGSRCLLGGGYRRQQAGGVPDSAVVAVIGAADRQRRGAVGAAWGPTCQDRVVPGHGSNWVAGSVEPRGVLHAESARPGPDHRQPVGAALGGGAGPHHRAGMGSVRQADETCGHGPVACWGRRCDVDGGRSTTRRRLDE